MHDPVVPIQAVEVAPLTGSVDRNIKRIAEENGVYASLPSRGAWIEMIV